MNIEIYYPGIHALARDPIGGRSEWGFAFPEFQLVVEMDSNDAPDPSVTMNNPFVNKVAATAAFDQDGVLYLETLYMWKGRGAVQRLRFNSNRSRNAYRILLRGAARQFASLPSERQVDLQVIERGPMPRIRVLWRY